MKEEGIKIRIDSEIKEQFKKICDEDTTTMSDKIHYFIINEIKTKSLKNIKRLKIESKNENVNGVLNDLFNNILKVEFNLTSWSREILKSKNLFLKLEIDKDFGIYDYRLIPNNEIERKDSEDLCGSTKFNWLNKTSFEEWQIAHFRQLWTTPIIEVLLLELRRIANIHLYFLGLEKEMDNFNLEI